MGLPPIHVRLDGPGRDSARHRAPGPGPGRARSRLARRGFRRQAGVAAAGLPVFGMPGSARTVLTRLGHSVAASALLGVSVALLFLRGPSEPTGGGRAASTPSRGSLGALWRHAASAAPGSGPFLCSEQCAGQGRSRAVGFIAGRSR